MPPKEYRPDLIFYTNSNTDPNLSGQIKSTIEDLRTRDCFGAVLFDAAKIPPRLEGHPDGPCWQAFRLFTHPQLVSTYHRFMLMEPDVMAVRPGWSERIMLEATTDQPANTQPFWHKGSRSHCAETDFEEFDHINGNSMYTLGNPRYNKYIAATWSNYQFEGQPGSGGCSGGYGGYDHLFAAMRRNPANFHEYHHVHQYFVPNEFVINHCKAKYDISWVHETFASTVLVHSSSMHAFGPWGDQGASLEPVIAYNNALRASTSMRKGTIPWWTANDVSHLAVCGAWPAKYAKLYKRAVECNQDTGDCADSRVLIFSPDHQPIHSREAFAARLAGVVSAFSLALLTDRVLLIDDGVLQSMVEATPHANVFHRDKRTTTGDIVDIPKHEAINETFHKLRTELHLSASVRVHFEGLDFLQGLFSNAKIRQMLIKVGIIFDIAVGCAIQFLFKVPDAGQRITGGQDKFRICTLGSSAMADTCANHIKRSATAMHMLFGSLSDEDERVRPETKLQNRNLFDMMWRWAQCDYLVSTTGDFGRVIASLALKPTYLFEPSSPAALVRCSRLAPSHLNATTITKTSKY